MDSYLKKFNKSVFDFVKELKMLFEEHDIDIENIETFYEMTKINARAIICPFQAYILKKKPFARYIMEEDVKYFMEYDFNEIISSDSPYSKYAKSLVSKFKQVVQRHIEEDRQVVKAMFDWFKLMTFYAASDLKLDIKELMNMEDSEERVTSPVRLEQLL